MSWSCTLSNVQTLVLLHSKLVGAAITYGLRACQTVLEKFRQTLGFMRQLINILSYRASFGISGKGELH